MSPSSRPDPFPSEGASPLEDFKARIAGIDPATKMLEASRDTDTSMSEEQIMLLLAQCPNLEELSLPNVTELPSFKGSFSNGWEVTGSIEADDLRRFIVDFASGKKVEIVAPITAYIASDAPEHVEEERDVFSFFRRTDMDTAVRMPNPLESKEIESGKKRLAEAISKLSEDEIDYIKYGINLVIFVQNIDGTSWIMPEKQLPFMGSTLQIDLKKVPSAEVCAEFLRTKVLPKLQACTEVERQVGYLQDESVLGRNIQLDYTHGRPRFNVNQEAISAVGDALHMLSEQEMAKLKDSGLVILMPAQSASDYVGQYKVMVTLDNTKTADIFAAEIREQLKDPKAVVHKTASRTRNRLAGLGLIAVGVAGAVFGYGKMHHNSTEAPPENPPAATTPAPEEKPKEEVADQPLYAKYKVGDIVEFENSKAGKQEAIDKGFLVRNTEENNWKPAPYFGWAYDKNKGSKYSVKRLDHE